MAATQKQAHDLAVQCLHELGSAPPTRRHDNLDDRVARMQAALDAGAAPAEWASERAAQMPYYDSNNPAYQRNPVTVGHLEAMRAQGRTRGR